MTDYTELYAAADKQFNREGFLEYQLSISRQEDENNKLLREGKTKEELIQLPILDQEWAETYIQPIANFMGDLNLWILKFGESNINLPQIDKRGEVLRGSIRSVPVSSDKHVARFSGSHWYSRKMGDPKEKYFNAFYHYQLNGTNQFCQTYAMMYLDNKLDHYPRYTPPERFEKYYEYTTKTLEYIHTTISSIGKANNLFNGEYSKKQMLALVKECLDHPALCLNLPHYDPKASIQH
jgi:hypothetical protein